jgi:hypothetical protein
VIVRREPSDGSIQVGVIEGQAWLGNRQSREVRHLEAKQWAQDRVDGMGPVQHLSQSQWDQVVAQDGLDLEDTDQGTASNGCQLATGKWRWANGFVYTVTADGRWRLQGGDVGGSWRCALNDSGDPEIYFLPDTRDWSARVVIAPDGRSLSGRNDTGDPAEAVRSAN